MKKALFFIITFIFIQFTFSQEIGNQKFYLIDSLELNELSDSNKKKLDSILIIFHQNENDSSVINLVDNLMEVNNSSIRIRYYYKLSSYYETVIAKTSNKKSLKQYKSTYVKIIGKIGNSLSYSNDIEGAINYWEEALQICYDENFESMTSYFLSELSLLYSYSGMHSKASRYALDALKIDEKNGDEKRLRASYAAVAYAFTANGLYDLALPYQIKALNLNTKRGDKKRMITSCTSLAYIYEAKNNLDSSYYYAQNALILAIEIDDQLRMVTAYDAIGSVLLEDGKFEESLINYSKGYAMAESIGAFGYGTSCLLGKGLSNARLGNYKEAKKYLTEIYEIGLEAGDLQLSFFASQELGNLNSTNKNWEEATKYYEISIPLLDSLLSSRNVETITSNTLQNEYEKQKIIDDKENEIALNIEKTDKDKQKIILYISLFSFLLIIIVVLISYKKINAKNSNLQKALDKNDVLAKELHHRVKNNLEVISSLLNLQARNIDNPQALSAIREGENRVNSIAIMHRKLYQTDTFSMVDFKQYTEELIDHLKTVFINPNQNIIIEVIAMPIKLDIDTAVPLGLIINELVSNSFKHAFKNKVEGKVTVSIKYADSREQQIILIVHDNGIGLPNNFNPNNLDSLGTRLVNMLASQLDGTVNFNNDNGTCVTSTVAKTELRKQTD